MSRRVAVCALLAMVLLSSVIGGVSAQAGAARADLDVEQPHYVESSVEEDAGGNTTTYLVRGTHQELRPLNFDVANVSDFGVEQAGASLTYDATTGEYVFDSGGQSGTYTVYWQVAVSQPVQGSANETVLRTQRYEAQIQVRTSAYAHIEQSRLDQLQEDSQNWTEVVSAFDAVGPDKPIEEELQDAIDAYAFLSNPFRALTGDFTAAVIVLTMTNGGRILLGLLVLLPLVAVAGKLLERRRLKQRLPDVHELDVEKLKRMRDKRKKRLVEVTPHDLPLDPRTADKLQEAWGENLWLIADKLHRLLPDVVTKRIFAQAMAHQGYVATYARDDGGGLVDVEIVHRDELDDEPLAGRTYDPLEPVSDDDSRFSHDEAVFEALSWDQIDHRALTEDVPLSAIDAPIKPSDVTDDLLAQTDVDVPEDFESREAFADALGEVCRYAVGHEYTTEDGHIKPERSALNLLSLLVTVTHERYDEPTMVHFRDIFIYLGEKLDSSDAVREAADRGGYGIGTGGGERGD